MLCRASSPHLAVVRQLLEEAVEWLRGKNTDQWSKPWPDAAKRDERIRQDLIAGKTWIAWDDATPVGTITVDTDDPLDLAGNPVWPAHKRVERALYVHRVIVRRSHAGLGLGAELFNWASDVAQREIGAPLIRIDVWTDNWDLHAYYRRQGFTLCEFRDPSAVPGYPSRALFERRTLPGKNGLGGEPLSEYRPAEPQSKCR
jgi:GNAT superfamily N-acetyltransferase